MMKDIESVRLRPAPEEDPPSRPDYFDHRYVLPQHRVKLLETVHEHERDARIVFHEEPHIYEINGFPAQASVSGMAAEFESEFDPDKGIMMMKKGKRNKWPRLQYVINARRISSVDGFVASQGGMIVDAETNETLAVCEGRPDVGADLLLATLSDTRTRVANEEHWYTFDRSMTDDEIKEAWERNGEDARNRGTEAHLQMELWFNSEPVRLDEGEVRVGLDFVRRCLAPIGARGYRTEWVIFGEEENIAGCIDLAVTLPSGDLYLVDWKRSEKLASKMTGRDKMNKPLQHLEDCSGCAYALQLGCYQYLLEKYYGKRIVGRALASIHPTAPFTTAVPYMEDEVEFLMARRRAMNRARDLLSGISQHRHLFCAKSGRLVMDAVRTEDGTLYDAKMAQLHQMRATPCARTTREARDLLEANMPNVPIASNLKKWRDVFVSTDDLLFYSRGSRDASPRKQDAQQSS